MTKVNKDITKVLTEYLNNYSVEAKVVSTDLLASMHQNSAYVINMMIMLKDDGLPFICYVEPELHVGKYTGLVPNGIRFGHKTSYITLPHLDGMIVRQALSTEAA